ncbi:Flp pilus assembly protein CpaB [Sandaracinus amylolyticus]|uniref:Flp pilus assembly protein CpaB n=1 Tax=Sandaracinus amylolyticus TaxID=927083 RepID=UPI00069CCE12|nr:Flp pilus assembly protein CpaB [Sandaracinus amylolyticus]
MSARVESSARNEPAAQRSRAVVAGVVCMALGAGCLFVYMQQYEQHVTGGAYVQVAVVTRDVPLGTPLREDALATQDMPERYVEQRHVRGADVPRVVGVRVSSALRAGETLLWSDLVTSEEHRDLSSLVRDGQRAVSIEADATSTFGGLLRPGDRVDVVLTTREGNHDVASTILQNALVLATGADIGADLRRDRQGTTRAGQVTLSMTLEQSQTLAVAAARGELMLVLRNPDDITIVQGLPSRSSDDLARAERR